MLWRWVRSWYGALLAPVLRPFAARGVAAQKLTLAGLAAMILAGGLFAGGLMGAGGVLVLCGGLLDGADGALARLSGTAGKTGAMLDSVCDHYGDFAIYLGLACWELRGGREWAVAAVMAAMFGSVFGSHVRSRAGMLGIELGEVGAVTRFERIIVLLVGAFAGLMTAAIYVLAVLNNFAAFQRVLQAIRPPNLERRGNG